MPDLRNVSVDALVTATKLRGSAAQIFGYTTPEGWPFAVIVAVGAPGNELAIQLAQEYCEKLEARTLWTEKYGETL